MSFPPKSLVAGRHWSGHEYCHLQLRRTWDGDTFSLDVVGYIFVVRTHFYTRLSMASCPEIKMASRNTPFTDYAGSLIIELSVKIQGQGLYGSIKVSYSSWHQMFIGNVEK